MATHSSTLAWQIPWTEEPGGLQSMGCQESDTTKATQQQQQRENPEFIPGENSMSQEMEMGKNKDK